MSLYATEVLYFLVEIVLKTLTLKKLSKDSSLKQAWGELWKNCIQRQSWTKDLRKTLDFMFCQGVWCCEKFWRKLG